MSMRDYGVNDYGYVFTEEMLEKLIDERFADELDHDDCEILAERMGLEYIGEFTGGAYHLDEKSDDNYNWDTLYYSGDTLYYFPLRSYSNLFSAAYSSKEELITDLKDCHGEWLPNDDNAIYDGVRHIIGTYFG